MIWVTIALFVASFLLTALLAPKPQFEDARAGTIDDLQFPQASEGSPIPLLLGRDRTKAPNTLWYGGFRAVAITEKVKTGLFSSKNVVVGHKYYITMDLGLCLGPNVTLRRIWIDKDQVWEDVAGPAEETIDIERPGLFGGEDKGGGFVGTLRFYGGSNSQAANAKITTLVGDVYPAYAGQCHIVLEDCYIGTQPALKPMSFELERTSNGLGLTGGKNLIGSDLNVMEWVFQVMTLDWGGLGLDTSELDVDSMIAVAEKLYDESNGLSMTVSSANTGEDLVGEGLRQMDGILYQDPTTGKIVADLIRNDYDVDELPVFDQSNVVNVRGFSRTSWEDTLNQVRVTYKDRSSKYEKGVAIQQDMANINAQGRLKSTNVSFPGVREGVLANELAAREMSQLSIPLYKTQLEANRQAATLRPGDPFIFSWERYGLEQVVMRVQKFNIGELIDGRIVMDCVQDEFASNFTVFAPPEDTLWEPVARDPLQITDYQVEEAPYFLVAQVDPVAVTQPGAGEGMVLAFARQPSSTQLGYSAYVSQDSFTTYFTGVEDQLYTNTAVLSADIDVEDGYVNGEITEITVQSVSPDASFLLDADASSVRGGRNLFFLNGELMAFLTVTDNLDGTYTLSTVKRALVDTAPQGHTAGDILYFVDSIDALALQALDATGDVDMQVRYSSYTDKGRIGLEEATTRSITPSQRYERPLPPDYITVDGLRDVTVTITDLLDDVPVTWQRRVRNTAVAFENDGDQGAETDVTYTLTVHEVGVTTQEYTDIDAAGYTVPKEDLIAFANPIFTVKAVDAGNGLDSRVSVSQQVFLTLQGYGNNYGNNYGN